MSEENVLFIPLTKVNVEKREVWGIAAEEAPDKSGEVMDYAASKPHFLEWSESISKASGGKSLGNVRAMHGAVAAGKIIHFEADDEALQFNVGARIVDEQEWAKVMEGVYTGFSIGGHYVRRWADPENEDLTRYEAKPHEISIVDNPAMYGATFEVIRTAGSEMRKFVGADGLQKVDLEAWVSTVRRAWHEQFGSDDPEDKAYRMYVRRVLDDAAIVEMDGKLLAYSYEMSKDGVTFNEPFEVRREYVPVASADEADESEDDMEPEESESETEPVEDEGEDMAQAVGADLQKSVSQALAPIDDRLGSVDVLIKSLSAELQRGLDEHAEQLGSLTKRLEALEAQPASESPVIREVPGSEHLGKAQNDEPDTALTIEALQRMAANEPNPLIKAEYNRQIVLMEMRLGQHQS